MMRLTLSFLLLGVLAGCADDGPRVEVRPATANDVPFGGGVPPSQHPGGDPFDANGRRTEIHLK